jgi:gamma-glutamyltranspeptidase/glutathione hydrolase
MAVAPHHLAAEAALAVMDDGGSAVDGAIAANAVLGVVLPETCGPGGDLFALVYRPGESTPHCLNASGRAGSGASASRLRAHGLTEIPFRSPASITVPGCVDGWEALAGRFGTLPLNATLTPAISLCGGFPTSPELAGALERAEAWLAPTDSAAELYPGGSPPRPGDSLARPRLADTLTRFAVGGRQAFFELIGPDLTESTQGAVGPTDYAVTQAEWVSPIGLDLFGRKAWTVPPNSQGYLTLSALGIAERLQLPRRFEDAAYHHGLVESYRAVSWDRNDVVADPDRAPRIDLLAAERLDERAAAISPRRATPWPDSPFARGGTAFMCAIDASGMGASLIQSNYTGFGSGLSAGGSGVFLHSRGAGFNLVPGHPNELAAGNRPLHTLAPTLWTRRGSLDMLLGTRGGHLQPQLLLQVAAHRMLLGYDLGDAVDAPRWALDELAGNPPVRVEPGLPDGLDERGHTVEPSGRMMEDWGPVSAIEVDAAGNRYGVADPRVSTAAVATG